MDPAELQSFRDATANLPTLVAGMNQLQIASGENTQGLQLLGGAVHAIQEELKGLT